MRDRVDRGPVALVGEDEKPVAHVERLPEHARRLPGTIGRRPEDVLVADREERDAAEPNEPVLVGTCQRVLVKGLRLEIATGSMRNALLRFGDRRGRRPGWPRANSPTPWP